MTDLIKRNKVEIDDIYVIVNGVKRARIDAGGECWIIGMLDETYENVHGQECQETVALWRMKYGRGKKAAAKRWAKAVFAVFATVEDMRAYTDARPDEAGNGMNNVDLHYACDPKFAAKDRARIDKILEEGRAYRERKKIGEYLEA